MYGQLSGYIARMGRCRVESLGSHLVSANNIAIRQSIYYLWASVSTRIKGIRWMISKDSSDSIPLSLFVFPETASDQQNRFRYSYRYRYRHRHR